MGRRWVGRVVYEPSYEKICRVNSSTEKKAYNISERIVSNFAVKLELGNYITRSGPIVQDPKLLTEEIEGLEVEDFEIICLIRKDAESVLLQRFVSYLDKEAFKNKNSGEIAEMIIEEENI